MAVTHVITSLLVASAPIVIGYNFNYDTGLIYLASTALGALIIDIDEPKSFAGRRLYFFSFLINMSLGHRTITHNYFIAIIGLILSWFYWQNIYAVGFFLGMAAHIMGDEMTGNVKGAYWPISERFSLFPKGWRFRVGGFVERVIATCSTILLIAIHGYGVMRGIL